MESGTIQYYPPEGGEETLSGMSPAAIRKLGIKLSFVPEDRLGMGLVAAMGMTDNMMLRGYKRGIPFFTDRRTPKAMAEQLIKELFKALPYVVTIIVLVFTSLRKKREYQPPASLGLAYFREER